MKKHTPIKKTERGQALILIVFAIIGLIAMTGLTVDGGMAYSDRRDAQNAADTAAFAAARAKIRQENWRQAALHLASANGYPDGDPTGNSTVDFINVEVYQCNEQGADCDVTLLPGDKLENYLQVRITSTVNTMFAGIVGISQVTNRVNAVARVTDPIVQPIGNGSAMWSLSDQCGAVTYGGSASVNLVGSGIYVNSKCDPNAFINNSNSPGLYTPCLQSAGGINTSGNSVHVENGCLLTDQPVLPYPTLPNFSGACPANGQVVSSNSSTQTLSPGTWTGAFPPNKANTILQSGVYCVEAGNQNFSLNANETITGENVTIYLISGGVTFNGQATVRLDAPDSGPYKGLLLYLPPTNSKPVSINGGGNSKIVGTILAPSSECNVLGGGGQDGLQTQLTCNTIKLGGGGNVNIVYNSENQYHPPVPPTIELTK
jgi:Flp pilus assembly protein TadG